MNFSLTKIRKEIKILTSIVSLMIVLVGWAVNGLNSHLIKVDSSIDAKKQVGQVSPQIATIGFSESDSLFAIVSRVVDGDTIVALPENSSSTVTLRLIGINTPETVDPRKKVECFGKEASAKAKELLTPKRKIRIEFDRTQGSRDTYGRLLGYVFIPYDDTLAGKQKDTELFFNKYMIEQGYAYEYTYNRPYRYQIDFKEAQRIAEREEKGLWSLSVCNGKK